MTGDNVDFRRADDEATAVIGTLSAYYKYGTNPENVIPKDLLIFTCSYKKQWALFITGLIALIIGTSIL